MRTRAACRSSPRGKPGGRDERDSRGVHGAPGLPSPNGNVKTARAIVRRYADEPAILSAMPLEIGRVARGMTTGALPDARVARVRRAVQSVRLYAGDADMLGKLAGYIVAAGMGEPV